MGLLDIIQRRWSKLRHGNSKLNYEEDFIRVYPEDLIFNVRGQRREATVHDRNNFLNHCKFYRFAAQFARGAAVADIGCGAGYGCKMLLDAGAREVVGADASQPALDYARRHYGAAIRFHRRDITALEGFATGAFDLTVSSEVLEHIKEYDKTAAAIAELKRITRPGGLLVIGTPNSELLGDHGFWFDEIEAEFKAHFSRFVIFENALEPFGERRKLWQDRQASGRVGLLVSENINLDETVLIGDQREEARVKQGDPPGVVPLLDRSVDTTLLHNTHSWVVLAVPD